MKLEKQYFFECVGLGLFVGICLAMQCCFDFYSHSFCLNAIVIFMLKNWEFWSAILEGSSFHGPQD